MSAIFWTSSVSKCSLRSFSRARGTISPSTKSRAVSRTRRCSSVSSNSITCSDPDTMPGAVADKDTWDLKEGDEIAPGRSVLKLLGGGHRYEVYLVWDDKRFAVMVAKVLRPDIAEDESAIR